MSVVLLAVLLGGCKKDDTNEPPTVEILAPGDGSTLTLPDTLRATLRVSDDVSVEHVSITLVDANGIPITTGAGTSLASSSATVELKMPVRSERIESGAYTLIATASDGSNDAHASRSIHVFGVPLRLRSVFAVTAIGANSTGLSRIDSLGNVSQVTTWNMDLGGAAVSSSDQTLFVCGGVNGPLMALSPDDHQVRWQKPNMSTLGEPYFSALGLGGDVRPYVGTSDGFLQAYNAVTGSLEFGASLPPSYRADHVLVMGELVLCTTHHIATQEQKWLVFQRSSGAPAGEELLDLAPVALFPRTDDVILLFGNTGGHGIVEEKSISLGSGWQPFTWSQPITAVGRVSSDKWLVALADGSVNEFTYSTASSIPVAQVPNVRDMAMGPLSGLMYAAAGTQVVALNSATGQVVATYPIGSDVHYVLPLFNREP